MPIDKDWELFKAVFADRFKGDKYLSIDGDEVFSSDLSFYVDDYCPDEEVMTEALANKIIDEGVAQAKAEEKEIEDEISKVRWKKGILYVALHRVGDDPVKGAIEDELGETFKEQPEVLNKIAQIFYKYTHDFY